MEAGEAAEAPRQACAGGSGVSVGRVKTRRGSALAPPPGSVLKTERVGFAEGTDGGGWGQGQPEGKFLLGRDRYCVQLTLEQRRS